MPKEGIQRGCTLSISISVICDVSSTLLPSDDYHAIPVQFYKDICYTPLFSSDLPEETHIGLFMDNTYLVPGEKEQKFYHEEYIAPETVSAYRIDNPDLYCQVIGQADVLCQNSLRIPTSLRVHLLNECNVNGQDLDCLLAMIKEHYPAYTNPATYSMEKKLYLPSIVAVLKRSCFEEFITFAETVIQAFFSELELSKLSKTRLQSFKHLYVLLFQVYLACSPSLEVKRCATVQFKHVEVPKYLSVWKNSAVPVVFASNERFAPALGVCITSLLDNIDRNRSYDIIVLESDLSEDSKQRLELTCKQYPQVHLRFFNPRILMGKRALQKNPTDHITIETYYRFLIADILPDYKKVLYLDCDTVILDDVGKLYDTEMHGNILAATLDPEVPSLAMGKDPSMKSYLQDVLGLQEGDPYFQAGVLVIDLKAMRSFHSVDQWIALVGERRYRFNDQDLLNKECRGRYQLLDMRWNTVVDCNHTRMQTIEDGPYSLYDAYTQARKDPHIVHYAGFEKPWDVLDSDFAYLFWHYAKRSEFFEQLLMMVLNGANGKKESIVLRLFPRGSRRRRFAKQLFYKATRI
jgi:lipopolysaccharide biosynthesis glycosyltransferase